MSQSAVAFSLPFWIRLSVDVPDDGDAAILLEMVFGRSGRSILRPSWWVGVGVWHILARVSVVDSR